MQHHETRLAIQREAIRQFQHTGYEATTLAAIGKTVGITRGAVLYHFASKEELLQSLVEPAVHAVDLTLRAHEPSVPTGTLDHQRALLTDLVTTLLTHRDAIALMGRISSGWTVADLGPRLQRMNLRLAEQLAGGRTALAHPAVRVRVVTTIAALGGVMGARVQVGLDSEAERQALTDALVAILRSGDSD